VPPPSPRFFVSADSKGVTILRKLFRMNTSAKFVEVFILKGLGLGRQSPERRLFSGEVVCPKTKRWSQKATAKNSHNYLLIFIPESYPPVKEVLQEVLQEAANLTRATVSEIPRAAESHPDDRAYTAGGVRRASRRGIPAEC